MSSPIPSTAKDPVDFKLDLVVEALRRGGRVQFRVWGMSMLPSLWPGDLVTLQTAPPRELLLGDIALVLCKKRCFLHRVIATQSSESGVSFLTRGDAMPDNDPNMADAELLGRVVAIRRGNRSFVPARLVSLADAALGWILCRSDLFRSLALRFHAARQNGWTRVGPPVGQGSFEKVLGGSRTSVSRQL